MQDSFVVFLASVLAGATNAVAGGGTLITFPTLVFVGLNPVSANITNTIALWVGSLSGAIGFRGYIKGQGERLKRLSIPSLLGGFMGAFLLVNTPGKLFDFIVPFLILFATLILAFKKRFVHTLGRLSNGSIYFFPLQFLIALYGGYFGAGIGILMLGGLSIMGIESIHVANGIKNLMGFLINAVASGFFLTSGYIVWKYATLMMLGFAIGGYFGAFVSTKIDRRKVELFTVIWGFLLSLVFFIRWYIRVN